MPDPKKSVPCIGFYSVLHSERTGWTGGYLLINCGGRPLEFHCTLPVRPSRAHEILYGTTLRKHLIGEAIGPVLLRKPRIKPLLVCCDQIDALPVAQGLDLPLLFVQTNAKETPSTDTESLRGYASLLLGEVTTRIAMEKEETVRQTLDALPEIPDFVEPFDRIREAIGEAQRKVTQAA